VKVRYAAAGNLSGLLLAAEPIVFLSPGILPGGRHSRDVPLEQ
jgi:hypothetical protein